MELQYTKIDIDKASVDEIKSEIERLQFLSSEYKSEEQSVKLLINSLYGALGNKWLVCFNPVVAEAITLQGQDLIKYAELIINKYFTEFWHQDKELHEKIGLTEEVKPIKKSTVVYMDTDSCYVSFEEVVNSCNYEGDPKEFILKINEYRLTAYLNKQFDNYAKKWNTINQQDFELENISDAGIWLAKKKYLLDVVWESGIDIDPLTQIIFKGIELAQSSTPLFAREKLKELVKYILLRKDTLDKREITNMMRKMKEEFKLAEPEKISMGRSISDYAKFILNDTTAFEVAKGPPIHVRAAGYFNYLLNKNEQMKAKYQLIRSGDKVKFYYVKTRTQHENDVFAYLPGNYPYELAPPIDYDLMFTKTILDPLNRIMEAIGLGAIPPGLQIVHALI